MFLSSLLQQPINFLIILLSFLIGLTVHEYAHAYVANRCGDPTAKHQGRLSLNPFVHLDPLGILFILIVGFGWAKPVPINPDNFRKKNDEIKVALAGIGANILLAFILGLPIRFALLSGHLIDSSPILIILEIIIGANLALAAFNLLPVWPLDGSRVVEFFLKEPLRSTYQSIGYPLLLSLLLVSQLTNVSIISVVIEPVIRFLSLLTRGTFSF